MSKRNRWVVVAVVAAVFAAALVWRETQRPEPRRSVSAGTPRGAEIAGPLDAAAPADSAGQALPRLVDLGANTCVPCKMMAPILEQLEDDFAGELRVEVIDIREEPGATEIYDVRVIPTQIFFDAAGRERFRHEGFMSREAILDKWEELGVALETESQASGSSASESPSAGGS
ncbi:MAG: thioredoxin [Candidatus Eisenbacteria bacterium]|nr:thioredoxin [Candidatus Eisenbacteria bacterium]